MVNGFLVFRALVGLDTLIQLIAGLKALASGHQENQREGCGGHHRKTYNAIHSYLVSFDCQKRCWQLGCFNVVRGQKSLRSDCTSFTQLGKGFKEILEVGQAHSAKWTQTGPAERRTAGLIDPLQSWA